MSTYLSYFYIYIYIYGQRCICKFLVAILDLRYYHIQILLGSTREHGLAKHRVAEHAQHTAVQALVGAQVFAMHEVRPQGMNSNTWEGSKQWATIGMMSLPILLLPQVCCPSCIFLMGGPWNCTGIGLTAKAWIMAVKIFKPQTLIHIFQVALEHPYQGIVTSS